MATGSLRNRRSQVLSLAVCTCPLLLSLPASAAVTYSGEVSPNPATWDSSTKVVIGNNNLGTLTLDGSSVLTSGDSYLGYISGSTGTVTITGAGSTWTSSDNLYNGLWVGYNGIGNLNVENGGKVNSRIGAIGWGIASSGTVKVTGAESSWTTRWLNVYSGTLTVEDGGLVTAVSLLTSSLGDFKGNGTISIKGLVSDVDLLFDATHGLQQAFSFGTSGVLNLNLDGTGNLGVGNKGQATMRIADGRAVSSTSGTIGNNSGSSGAVTVTGTGSTWVISDPSLSLYVGYAGTGMLTIENGGTVSSIAGQLGAGTGGSGTVTVTGAGSNWTMSGNLSVGQTSSTGTMTVGNGGTVSSNNGYLGANAGLGTVKVTGPGSIWRINNILSLGSLGGVDGKGTLTIADSGKVTAKSLSLNSGISSVNLHVSGSDMLVLGDATTAGSVTNRGRVNFYANAFLASGTYTPISDLKSRTITWSPSGIYSAFGGTWDDTAKTFTVASATPVAAGTADTLTTGERLLITGSGGNRVGASFGTVAGGITFSAGLMTPGELSGLTPSAGQSVLSAWDFTTNLPAGQSVLLSFDVGDGASNLQVWHYSSNTWTSFTADDLLYSNGIASFTVTGFSGYAVTGSVPEPSSLCLVLLVGGGLLRRRRA